MPSLPILYPSQQGLSQRTLRSFVCSTPQGPVPETLLRQKKDRWWRRFKCSALAKDLAKAEKLALDLGIICYFRRYETWTYMYYCVAFHMPDAGAQSNNNSRRAYQAHKIVC